MKTIYMTLLFAVLFFSESSSQKSVTDYDKKKAFEKYTACRQISDEWLKNLDSSYSLLLSIKPIKYVSITDISSYIDSLQETYGKIIDRKFLLSLIWSDEILFTYAPDIDQSYLNHFNAERSKDGFYLVEPKYFGLVSNSQMFAGFPSGDYVILLNKISTSKVEYVEERLILWHKTEGSWQIVAYDIRNDF
ncbi:MAG: hypothetical protein ACM3NR_01020 [Methanosarcina sp.]